MKPREMFINSKLHTNNKGQIITLTGAILAFTIISIATLSAQLSTIGSYVPAEKSESIMPEFMNVKETFAYAVDKLTDDISSDRSILNAFNTTRDRICRIESQHGLIFNATLDEIHYRNPYVPLRYITVTLKLTDGYTTIVKTMDIPLHEK